MPKNIAKPKRTLTDNETERLIKALQYIDEDTRLAVLMSLQTGLRLGEICALTWSDFDKKSSQIKVNGTINAVRSSGAAKVQYIKTELSSNLAARVVPVPTDLRDALVQHKKKSINSKFMLTNEGRLLMPRTVQKRFNDMIEKLRINDVSFESLRNTFAAKALANGEDIVALSKTLGHASAGYTINRVLGVQ